MDPPTNTISSISFGESFASFSALSSGCRQRSIRSPINSSNFARVTVCCKCFGCPDLSIVINGKLMFDSGSDESSFLVFSHASCNRCNAMVSLRRSTPDSFWNSSATKLIKASSRSSPPRCVSPLVLITSKTFTPSSSFSSRTETSNVPPPRSKTTIF